MENVVWWKIETAGSCPWLYREKCAVIPQLAVYTLTPHRLFPFSWNKATIMHLGIVQECSPSKRGQRLGRKCQNIKRRTWLLVFVEIHRLFSVLLSGGMIQSQLVFSQIMSRELSVESLR